MVTPTSGPFVRSHASGAVIHQYQRTWSRQKKPYNLPLPGSYFSSRVQMSNDPDEQNWPYGTGLVRSWYSAHNLLYAKSRTMSKVYDQLAQNDEAALGVTLVQYSQAVQTIVQRSRQLLDFSIALRYLNFPGMYRALSVSAEQYRSHLPDMPGTKAARKRGWRDMSSEYGGAWLEWSWGVKPMIDDIQTSCRILQSDVHHLITLETTHANGSKSRGVTSSEKFDLVLADSLYLKRQEKGKSWYKLCLDARLKNYNSPLWTQLGLDDPLAIGFEVIPWSFLLSWVSNVEVYLKNWSSRRDSFYFENICETVGRTSEVSSYRKPPLRLLSTHTYQNNTRAILPFLPKVTFTLKPLRFSPLRAANAVALLSTFLGSGSHDIRSRGS